MTGLKGSDSYCTLKLEGMVSGWIIQITPPPLLCLTPGSISPPMDDKIRMSSMSDKLIIVGKIVDSNIGNDIIWQM